MGEWPLKEWREKPLRDRKPLGEKPLALGEADGFLKCADGRFCGSETVDKGFNIREGVSTEPRQSVDW